MISKKGFFDDSVVDVVLWIILLILAGFSVYLLFKKFSL